MNRKLELAKKKKETAVKNEQLTSKEIEARSKLLEATENLYELINGQEQYDFDKLHKQLVEIDKRLDLAPYFKSLEDTLKLLTPPTKNPKTKIEGFSELLKAVNSNKPIPTKIDLSSLEKSIVNIERYIREQSESSDQGAENYQPVRRVIKVGNRFIFDDNFTNAGGGGSGGDSTGGNTTVDNFPTEYPLPAAQVTTLTPPAAITGFATSAKQDTAQTALDAIKTSVETLDNAISGSEMQVDVVGSLPAGNNAIGKLSANSGVDIGDVDVTSAVSGTLDHGSNLDIDTSAEQITSTSFACKFGVTLKADITNTGIIYIGNSDVTAGTTAATDGFPLSAGETLTLEVNNANIPYAIASANNQKIYWVGV